MTTMDLFVMVAAVVGLLALVALAVLVCVHIALKAPDGRLRQIIEHEQFRADQRLQQLTQDALTDMLQASRPGTSAAHVGTLPADEWYQP